jgi:transcription elongation factor Elf1
MSDFKNKKEDEALKYLQNNFIGDENDNLDTVKKVDMSYLDNVPNNEYLHIPLNILPCGLFYKNGTKISIRSAKVQEVQAYSIVDDKNFLDITEKMNQILSSCSKFVFPNGTQGSYKDIKDGDRLFLIFMIRELTFPGGKNLSKDVTCGSCGHEFKMELRATNSDKIQKSFVNYDMPEKLAKFFNEEERVFILNINGVDYKLAPPTIGIQEIFYGDIRTKVQSEKNPNVAFLKLFSFMLHDRNKITEDGIKAKEQEFKRMDMKTFQILNSAINRMLFGIKEMKNDCPSCGLEVRTDMNFPSGASSIFVISDAIDEYFG